MRIVFTFFQCSHNIIERTYKVVSLLKFTWDEGEDSFLACPPQLTLAIGQREVAVPYRWGRVRLCKRYGVICTATPRHPGRPIMSHARAGRCATGVHRCFMRPGISTPAVRGARLAELPWPEAGYASSGAAAPLAHPLLLRGAEPPLPRHPTGGSTHPS